MLRYINLGKIFSFVGVKTSDPIQTKTTYSVNSCG